MRPEDAREIAPERGEDGLGGQAGVEDRDASWLPPGAAPVGRADPTVKRERLALEPVDGAAAPSGDARQGSLDRAVEKIGAVRLEGRERPVERVDSRLPEAPARPLVGAGGVGVPVAEDDGARSERRLDRLGQVLAPVRQHEEELGGGVEAAGRLEEDPAKVLANGGPARLSRRENGQAERLEADPYPRELRRLARPLDPLERDEEAPTPPPAAAHGARFSHGERTWHAVRILPGGCRNCRG